MRFDVVRWKTYFSTDDSDPVHIGLKIRQPLRTNSWKGISRLFNHDFKFNPVFNIKCHYVTYEILIIGILRVGVAINRGNVIVKVKMLAFKMVNTLKIGLWYECPNISLLTFNIKECWRRLAVVSVIIQCLA